MIRNTILSDAVTSLTSSRSSSAILKPEEVSALVEYSLKVLGAPAHSSLAESTWIEFVKWREFHESRIQVKKASDLKVIYLCGPEPLNDLAVLTKLGVNPHNIWALESDKKTFEATSEEIRKANVPLKTHHGSIEEFFRKVNEDFDIAYVDGTRPFLSTKPRSLSPVFEILSNERLTPLSVLITNYSEPPQDQLSRYSQVLTDYFRYRYNDLPEVFWKSNLDPAIGAHDPSGYPEFIASSIHVSYSEFITRLTVDLARWWIPTVTAISSGAVLTKYSASPADRRAAVQKAIGPETIQAEKLSEIIEQMGDTQLSPSSYPLLSFLRSLKFREPNDTLIDQMLDWKLGESHVEQLVQIGACLDRIAEGHWRIASQDLLEAITTQWFDSARPYTCDLPLPNLLINSLLGIYGHPHYRSAASSRYAYKSKSNVMYLDCFVFDRCRSFFDWFPTISQVPSRFTSKSFQIVARCLLDRINSCDANSDSHPFRGSAVAGFYELTEAPFHFMKPRTDL